MRVNTPLKVSQCFDMPIMFLFIVVWGCVFIVGRLGFSGPSITPLYSFFPPFPNLITNLFLLFILLASRWNINALFMSRLS